MEFEIDRGALQRVEGGERRTVRVRVPQELRYLEGHFPGNPIVPGVAQLVPLAYREARAAWPDLGAPTGIKRLKFLEALRPGDELALELLREPAKVRFEIRRGPTLCTHGVLTF